MQTNNKINWQVCQEIKRWSEHSSIHYLKGRCEDFSWEYRAQGLVVDGKLYPNSIKFIQPIK